MFNQREAIQIVDKLIELTQHGVMAWTKEDPPGYMNTMDSRVDLIYVASHLGRRMRVYVYHFKYYFDESSFVWDQQVKIEIIDSYDRVEASFPKVPNSMELLSSIQYQNPNVGNFYKDIFGRS